MSDSMRGEFLVRDDDGEASDAAVVNSPDQGEERGPFRKSVGRFGRLRDDDDWLSDSWLGDTGGELCGRT